MVYNVIPSRKEPCETVTRLEDRLLALNGSHWTIERALPIMAERCEHSRLSANMSGRVDCQNGRVGKHDIYFVCSKYWNPIPSY